MPLTENETFGTVVPGFVTHVDGRLSVAAEGENQQITGGFLRDVDGRLVVSSDPPETIWGGFARRETGALCLSTSGNSGEYGVVPGFKADPDSSLGYFLDGEGQTWDTGFLRIDGFLNLLTPGG